MDKIKVCIVEDHDDMREVLEEIISLSDNCECIGVMRNAEEALKMLPALKPDIVMMDINLGKGENGIECVRKLKPYLQKTNFMMCTVYDDIDSIFEALTAGATSYMLKRTSPDQMIESITELYHGGSPMNSSIARKVSEIFRNSPPSPHYLDEISPRQNDILKFLARGMQYKEIAEVLDLSIETIRKHVHKIYQSLHVTSRVEAVNKFFGR